MWIERKKNLLEVGVPTACGICGFSTRLELSSPVHILCVQSRRDTSQFHRAHPTLGLAAGLYFIFIPTLCSALRTKRRNRRIGLGHLIIGPGELHPFSRRVRASKNSQLSNLSGGSSIVYRSTAGAGESSYLRWSNGRRMHSSFIFTAPAIDTTRDHGQGKGLAKIKSPSGRKRSDCRHPIHRAK